MAALADIKVQVQGQMLASGVSLTPQLWDELSPFIAKFFWSWYEGHKTVILLRAGWLFIHFTVRVQDLDSLFTSLFGPEPQVATTATNL